MSRKRDTTGGGPGVRALLRRFAPEIRAQRRWILISSVALLGEVALRLLEPWPVKLVFDAVLAPAAHPPAAWMRSLGPDRILLVAVVALLAIAGGRAVMSYWSSVGFAVAGTRVLGAVRDRLFRHLHRLPLAFHQRARQGDLILRVLGDVGFLQDVTVTALLPLLLRSLVLLGMVSVMFWMNPRLALLALSVIPLFWIRGLHLGRQLQEVGRQQRRREGAMAATVAESLAGMKVIQALSVADEFSGAFQGQNEQSLRQGVRGKRLAAGLERSVDVLIAVASALVLWEGARLVQSGALSPGDLLVFLAYLKSAFRPLQDLAKFTGRLGKAGAAGARVLEILDEPVAVADRPGAVEANGIRGEIRLEGVSVAHEPGRPVLEGVDLCIPAGSMVVVTGESGSGKSTLLGLLVRLQEPDTGIIRLDGRDLRDFQIDSLRRQFGVVLQENLLFSGTLRENLCLGMTDVDPQRLDEAVRMASLESFVRSLPQGLETPVGERGVTLSQGQRQRLTIARAALREARIYLFDEPISGLDADNAREVAEGLRRLGRGHTTLWVTHDASQVPDCDLHLEVGHGRVRCLPGRRGFPGGPPDVVSPRPQKVPHELPA